MCYIADVFKIEEQFVNLTQNMKRANFKITIPTITNK